MEEKTNARRDFLSKLGMGVVAGAVLSPLVSSASKLLLNNEEGVEIKNFEGKLEDLLGGDFENIKLKMQDDLRRALKKPMKERRWGMALICENVLVAMLALWLVFLKMPFLQVLFTDLLLKKK